MFTLLGVCHNNQGGSDTHQAALPLDSQNDYTLPGVQTYISTLIENMFIAYRHLASNVFFELCLPLRYTHTHTEWIQELLVPGRSALNLDNVLRFPRVGLTVSILC